MTDNFNVSWPKFARKQIFIPKRLDSMFGRALVSGWRPFVNKMYNSTFTSTAYTPVCAFLYDHERSWCLASRIKTNYDKSLLFTVLS